MSNVLLLFESYEPTNAELYKLLSLVAAKGAIHLKKCICAHITVEDINWCDIIVSVRSTSAMEWRLARYARMLGKYWIFMLDDDFLSLDGSYGKDGQGYREERKSCLKKVLQYTDCLLAVNKLLAEKYTRIGGISRYVLTNTPFDCAKLVKPGIYNRKTKLIFYVNDGTQTMFNLYLRPLFGKLCESLADRIAVYFLAVKPDMKEFENKLEIHYVPHMHFEEFLKYIAGAHFDIGLAPLDEEGFSKYKYFNKYVEFTRAGITGIYTDCLLYRQVVEPGYNGVLCNNTADSWMQAIISLVQNPEKRVAMAENAQQYARNNFRDDKVIEKLLEDLSELENYKAPHERANAFRLTIFKVHYWSFRFRGWFCTAYSCIRSGHPKAIIKRIKARMAGSR